jgi:hypothetical protein
VGEVIPLPPASQDEPWFICIGCDNQFSRRSAPNPIQVGDFVFCSVECQRRWIADRHPGMR